MKKETLEDFCTRELSNFNDNVRNTQFDLGFRTGAIIGLRFPKERSYSEEEARSSLRDLSLVNPAHLTMTSDGYGEFPDSYKLTEKDINYIIEQFKNKKMKETLEDFTKEVLQDEFFTNIAEYGKAERLIEIGAKWQQERMYSEE